MVLKIKLGIKKEKRLMKHLKEEHPSVRGHISVNKKVKDHLKESPYYGAKGLFPLEIKLRKLKKAQLKKKKK